MVNKRIVFFWEGERMSWCRYMTLKSFRELNPSWDMSLYLGSGSTVTTKTWKDTPTQDFHNFSGRNYLIEVSELDIKILPWTAPTIKGVDWNKKLSPSHKSNLFKWEFLAGKGGIYCDLDILFTKPMGELYEQIKSFDLCLGCEPHFSIGLMSSIAPNKFFKDVYTTVFKSWSPKGYQTAGVTSIYTLLFNEKQQWNDLTKRRISLIPLIKTRYPNLTLKNLDNEAVYHWDYNALNAVFNQNNRLPNSGSIGIHWYAGAKISQEYNNKLNHETMLDYDNTFCHYARKFYS